MSPVAAPADKRFRRAHVKPSRRRRAWQAWIVPTAKYAVVGALLLFGVYRLGAVGAQARMLHVDRLVIHGNQRLPSGVVETMLHPLIGQSLVWADLAAWRGRLMASPWVRDAALRRSLPSTVEVVIVERRPVAIGRFRGEMYLIDDRGTVIEPYGPQYADLDLPIVDGLTLAEDAEGAPADEPRAELAARVIGALAAKPAVARRLSQIDVSDLHNAAVILNDDPAVIHLGEERFLERVEAYLDLAPTLRESVADIDYVDLRFDDRVYVRPAASRRARGGEAASHRDGGTPAPRPGKPARKH